MDAMSLLCTLHADGPVTLKRLRSAGCSTLEALEGFDPGKLGEILCAPPAAARRFVREARSLRERLDAGLLEREEPVASAALPGKSEAGVAADDEPADHLAESQDPSTGPADPAGGFGADETAGERLSHEVLEAWRLRDEQEPPDDHAALPHPEIEEGVPPRTWRARPEFEFGLAVVAASRGLYEECGAGGNETVPAAEAGTNAGMGAGAIDGLDAETARRLAAAGIATREQLVRADALELSARTGIGYTRLWRLRMLARRSPEPAPAPSRDAPEVSASWGPPRLRFSPAEVPQAALGQEPPVVEIVPAPARERPRTVHPVPAPSESPGGPFA